MRYLIFLILLSGCQPLFVVTSIREYKSAPLTSAPPTLEIPLGFEEQPAWFETCTEIRGESQPTEVKVTGHAFNTDRHGCI